MEKTGAIIKTNKPEYDVKNPICWKKGSVKYCAYSFGIRSYYEKYKNNV